MSGKVQYLNKATVTRLNRVLENAGYPQWIGDRTTSEPKGCGAGYAKNCIDYLAGNVSDDRREVESLIAEVTGIWE